MITPKAVSSVADKVQGEIPEGPTKLDQLNELELPKKFLGLPKWLWFVLGGIMVFAILTVAIVLALR